MSLKIRLRKGTDSGRVQEFVLQQDIISIGREATDTIRLDNPLISRVHAQIECHGGVYYLTDMKSRNFTYLNGEKLVPEQQYTLKDGDRVKICDFVLECVLQVPHPAEPEAKPQANAGVSAPTDGVSVLVRGLVAQYSNAESLQQRATLKLALVDLLEQFEHDDLQALSRADQLQEECDRLSGENRTLQSRLADKGPPQAKAEPRAVLSPELDTVERLNAVVQTLVGSFMKLVTGRSSFRTEFLGMTTVQDPGSAQLSGDSIEGAMAVLFDPQLTGDQAKARIASLRDEADETILHVMGLLEGYRKSVETGVHKLLQAISPDLMHKELAGSVLRIGPFKIPYRYIPGMVEWKLLQLIHRRYRELTEEDRGIWEKRFFRPGFIQGYESCVASARRDLRAHQDPIQKGRSR